MQFTNKNVFHILLRKPPTKVHSIYYCLVPQQFPFLHKHWFFIACSTIEVFLPGSHTNCYLVLNSLLPYSSIQNQMRPTQSAHTLADKIDNIIVSAAPHLGQQIFASFHRSCHNNYLKQCAAACCVHILSLSRLPTCENITTLQRPVEMHSTPDKASTGNQ